MSVTASDQAVELLVKIADGALHEVTSDSLRPYVHFEESPEVIERYLSNARRPSDIPGYADAVRESINRTSTTSITTFNRLMGVLDSRVLAPILTNSLSLIRDMTPEQREKLLQSWKDSPIAPKRKLFRSLTVLSLMTYAKMLTEDEKLVIGYTGKEMRSEPYPGFELDTFRYTFLDTPHVSGHKLDMPHIDVLIIGSGSGAGVAAKTISEAGYTSLVIEKGAYYHPSEHHGDDGIAVLKSSEAAGSLVSTSASVAIMAGSTFGGGSTINWSASLKTPFKVRKEWYDDYGLDFAASGSFDECLDYVYKGIGATTEGIDHSIGNQAILEGSKKLGYPAKEVPQNNAGHQSHNCGLCHQGCPFGIKGGSAAVWFREPAEKGTQFMTNVVVDRLLHSKGKAYGVECHHAETGVKFTITGPKQFVVAGGTLNTPVVLQKSGFKNKNIGSNTKLHPATVVWGDIGKENAYKPFESPILSTVCDESSDLDGKYHGARVETVLLTPFVTSGLTGWKSALQIRASILKYRHMIGFVIICRDTTSGTVTYDKAKPESILVDYDANRFDRDALLAGVVTGCDIMYVEGAKVISPPGDTVPDFVSDKHKNERSINDVDYQEWRSKLAKSELKLFLTPMASAHQMSSCRMASTPKKGAVDANGRLWECNNVWVTDGSALPTASGVNPMVSIMAVARNNSLNLVKELGPKGKF